jgi:Uma2 family endonuclease
MTISSSVDPDLFYPESDGKPMAENTEQFRWIVMIKENLEILFADQAEVFIAGDLLWYPIEGDNTTTLAPDTMVVFGRPKGKRGSYQQWKEANIPPQVVFEIMSPSNTAAEMREKRDFYQQHGVEEYYIYDPDLDRVSGWMRQGNQLVAIAAMQNWVSPLLKIRFFQPPSTQRLTLNNQTLEIYRPDGRKFLTSVELDQRAEQERQRAEQERQRAEQERQRAEQARQQAQQERQRAEHAQQRAQQEQQRAEQAESHLTQVVQNLLQSGMAIAQVATLTGLSIEQVEAISSQG